MLKGNLKNAGPTQKGGSNPMMAKVFESFNWYLTNAGH
jgi:hypothetical protein